MTHSHWLTTNIRWLNTIEHNLELHTDKGHKNSEIPDHIRSRWQRVQTGMTQLLGQQCAFYKCETLMPAFLTFNTFQYLYRTQSLALNNKLQKTYTLLCCHSCFLPLRVSITHTAMTSDMAYTLEIPATTTFLTWLIVRSEHHLVCRHWLQIYNRKATYQHKTKTV